MVCKGAHRLQLGQKGFFLVTGNAFAPYMEVAVYECARCGKIEFYNNDTNLEPAEDAPEECEADELPRGADGTPQKACPRCGKAHDFDDPKCPLCGYRYEWSR